MPTEVLMPQMGESIFEGTITKWLKQPGDAVEKDEPLLEISTDKVDAEIPSPAAGVLAEIRFPEGATVEVNTVLAVLAEKGATVATPAAKTAKAQTAALPKAVKPRSEQKEQTAGAPPAALAPPASLPAAAIEVVMPQMGESIFEGTITKWLKQTGDTVRKDEPLLEISTDKVDAEIPAPADGVLTEIRIAAGETVEVNTVLAVLNGGAAGAPPAAAAPAGKTPPPPESAPAAPVAPNGRRLRSSPLVRRIASEKAIDLARVPGTGSAGRITKEDILRFQSQPQAASGAGLPSGASAPSAPPLKALTGEVVPMTRMRAIIAARMAESKRTIPHAHTVYKIDMTRIARLRERERGAFEQRHGVKLTYMPFIAAAAVDALRQFPVINASLIESSIHYHGNIHLGIAVALEWGLIVPVICNAETASFVSLARSIADLAARARTKKLLPDEVGGSTFTLTNSGVFGGEYGTPIINPPEAAILAIGGLRKEPAVVTDGDGNDSIAIRSMQYFCLGFDHRLIDGADSGKFMSALKSNLEAWDRPLA